MSYLTPEEAVKLYNKYGSIRNAAKQIGMPRTTFRRRLSKAKIDKENNPYFLEVLNNKQKVDKLLKDIRKLKAKVLTSDEVREHIIGIKKHNFKPPRWLEEPSLEVDIIGGTPSIMLSDFHWSEVVDPDQVFGENEYNIRIAEQRLRKTIDRVITILKHNLSESNYPGIVVNLAGDLISGDIHDELTTTNEKPVMPTFLNLYDNLAAALKKLANEFGNVFVPCVHGNHSRNTKKIQSKDQAYTNFDWLLYNMLEKHFEKDERVNFYVSDGVDLQYKVYNHTYRLTHGNQFRGGSGIIGFIYPVARGHQRKYSAASTYNQAYDTLLLGHFHQYITLGNVIVNGSLVGYNEYALSNNFTYELPKQALWITNPKYGITMNMPVLSTECDNVSDTKWVSIQSK